MQSSNKVAVCIPTYHGSAILKDTLDSLLKQTYQDFVVYISDDTSPSALVELANTKELIESYQDDRFQYRANETNLGYPLNLIGLVDWSTEDFIFLLAQDDVLSEVAIEACLKCFEERPGIGAVARPYFWFQEDLSEPVRQIHKLNGPLPHYLDSDSAISDILHVLVSVSQLTGLMYRRSKLSVPFANSVFPAHIYPFAGALRDHGVAFLPFHTVAVSIQHSQTRTVSSIYEESPAQAWVDMYKSVFGDEKYSNIMNAGICDHMGKNYVGLVQIRSYGKFKFFVRECRLMLTLRHKNWFSPKFWFSTIALAVLPRWLIQQIVDQFKKKILSRTLTNCKLATIEDLW